MFESIKTFLKIIFNYYLSGGCWPKL